MISDGKRASAQLADALKTVEETVAISFLTKLNPITIARGCAVEIDD